MKRTFPGLFLVIILLGWLVSSYALQLSRAAQPNAAIYIKDDGSVEPSSAPIKREGNVYTFTDDVEVELGTVLVEGRVDWCGIMVQKSNIVINGGGYKLIGEEIWRSGSWRGVYTGLWISGLSDIVVGNFTFQNFFDGIYIGSTSNIEVSKNNVSNSKCGMSLEYSSNNVIIENKFDMNHVGICLYESSSNTISENTISNNVDAGEVELAGIIGPARTLQVSGISLIIAEYNKFSKNLVQIGNGNGLLLAANSANNEFTQNTIDRNQKGIVVKTASNNNIFVGNNFTNNQVGVKFFPISVTHPYPSSNNKIYYNNFINNHVQVEIEPNSCVNSWDWGYPIGGNYWDTWQKEDKYSGENQDEEGGDGILDQQYVIESGNIDRYPLRYDVDLSSPGIHVRSITYTIPDDTGEFEYTDTGGRRYTFRSWVIAVPDHLKVKIEIKGVTIPFVENSVIEYRRANEPIASHTITDGSFQLSFELALTDGVFEDSVVLVSDGNSIDQEEIKVLSYEWSGFKVTEDDYGFKNFKFSLGTFTSTIKGFFEFWDVRANFALVAAIPLLYPLVSISGHCYGMSLSSILFYKDQLSPPSKPVHELSRDDSQAIISKYHVKQIIDITSEVVADLLLGNSISGNMDEEFGKAKNLINNDTPALLRYPGHAVTIVGYVETEAEKYWIINDSNFPGKLVVFEVTDQGINVWSTGYGLQTDVEVFTPVPWPEDAPDLLLEAVTSILGELVGKGKRVIGFGSPVDVSVVDASGNELSVIGEEIAKNEIEGAIAYSRDGAKSILLPWDTQFTVEVKATAPGEATIGDIALGNVTLFENITLQGSEIITATLEPGKPTSELSIDGNGDGEIDFKMNPTNTGSFPAPTPMPPTPKPTITPTPTSTPDPTPFDPSLVIYASIIIVTIILIVTFFVMKKRRKSHLPPPPPPPPPC